MAASPALSPSAVTRAMLRARGAIDVARCYQCGTCSSVCEAASRDFAFPRRQVLLAQWGLEDRLAADPAVWLCHACGDCSTRCPREAKPADVLQAARAAAVEGLATPAFMGKLVGRAKTTWPLLLGIPILFWILFIGLATGFGVLEHDRLAYEHVVPHWMIYAVFFPVAGYVVLVSWVSGRRFWKQLDGAENRRGSLLTVLGPAGVDIAMHRRFALCRTAGSRRWGHLALVWGFIGAAITSGLLIVAIYLMHEKMPLSLWHPFKILGNVSAVLLVVGGGMLLRDRMAKKAHVGSTTAFDFFFLGVVELVITTGVAVEVARFVLGPQVAVWLYIVHLGAVMCLFLTTPYSKFAHILYRTLAMAHERMVGAAQPEGSGTPAGSLARSPS